MSVLSSLRAGTPLVESRPDRLKVLFIGGAGRSGSTLMSRLLGQVPGVISVGELVFLWDRGVRDNELCSCGEPFRGCELWSAVGDALGGWDRYDPEHILDLRNQVERNRQVPLVMSGRGTDGFRNQLTEYQDVLAALYAALADVTGARIIVDSSKRPSYALTLSQLDAIELRIVHLVRDSHGVCYSWSRQVRRPEIVGTTAYMPTYGTARAALEWTGVNALLDVLAARGVPTERVRYEDLVLNPTPFLRNILGSLGENADLTPSSADGSVSLSAQHNVGGNPMRFQRGATTLRVDSSWQAAMPRRTRSWITFLTAPGLLRYGYVGSSNRVASPAVSALR